MCPGQNSRCSKKFTTAFAPVMVSSGPVLDTAAIDAVPASSQATNLQRDFVRLLVDADWSSWTQVLEACCQVLLCHCFHTGDVRLAPQRTILQTASNEPEDFSVLKVVLMRS